MNARSYDEIIGREFERLTVLSVSSRIIGSIRRKVAECQCTCGKTTTCQVDQILSGHTRSCGCLSGVHRGADGKSRSPEYGVWREMLKRCSNPRHISFAAYGGRGIAVCDRWSGENGFANFLADMGERPSRRYSIDRINNSNGYSPDNCRWATKTTQNSNRRSSYGKGVRRTPVMVTHNGETMCLMHWAQRLGIKRKNLSYHVHRGRTISEIIARHQ